jgi:hypothetical protein
MNSSFWTFYLFDYIICTILSFLFTKYFASKKVSKFIKIFSRLFIFANCLLIFTLPYEIVYYNLRQDQIDEEKKQQNNISTFFFSNFSYLQDISNETNKTELEQDIEELRGVLRVNYGIIFWVLASVANLLFFLIGYLKSGQFTFWKKITEAIKRKIMFMIIPLIIASILALIYKNLVGALFFIFGSLPIAYIIGFLAISIVKIPRIMYISIAVQRKTYQ